MLIEQIRLTNLLSFGCDPEPIAMRPLNLIIGPNGSGKSNLLEAVDLLRNAPGQFTKPLRDGGGIRDWLWKGTTTPPVAGIDVVLFNPFGPTSLRYVMSFTELAQRFQIVDERIENQTPAAGQDQPYFYYRFQDGRPVLNVKGESRALRRETIDPDLSILAQRRDPDQYPEITDLANRLGAIRLYREWSFGRYTAPRMPQKADLPNATLEADASNLGLVLNRLRRDPTVKRRILTELRKLYDGVDDFDVQIEGGTVQVFLQEGRISVPATRLSDGTLRNVSTTLIHPGSIFKLCD